MLATGLSYTALRDWTPRQLWALGEESHRQAREMEAAQKGERYAEADPGPPAPAGKQYPPGARDLGLTKYDCWALTPEELAVMARGEDPASYAPFLVPREIQKARTEALFYEHVARGFYEAGVNVNGTLVRIARTDMNGARDLFELAWRADCAKYERAKAARAEGKTDGVPER